MRCAVKPKKPRFFFVLVLAAALSARTSIAASNSSAHLAKVHVTYRLKWLFNVSVVGDLYAKTQGIFSRNGLDVTILPGGPERDAIRELELGRAQFGVASADQIIRAASRGASVRVLAQLFQVNPLHWIYRPHQTPFSGPEDLRGRTVGITYGGNDEAIMRALLSRYRIPENELRFFSVRYDYTPFYRGQVDFWPLYINAQAPIIGGRLAAAGERYSFLNPADFGIRFVANSVITSRHMLEKHAGTVRRFMAALLEGWRRALDPENRDKAVAVVLRFNRRTPAAIVRKQLPVTRRLMMPGPGAVLGRIDLAAWKQTEAIMLSQKLIAAPIHVEKLLVDPVKY